MGASVPASWPVVPVARAARPSACSWPSGCGGSASRAPGTPDQSDANAARLWEKDSGKTRIATGDALSDGCWRQRGRALSGGTIHETADEADPYYGVELGWKEALAFRRDHLHAQRFPDRLRPPDPYFRKRAGAVADELRLPLELLGISIRSPSLPARRTHDARAAFDARRRPPFVVPMLRRVALTTAQAPDQPLRNR